MLVRSRTSLERMGYGAVTQWADRLFDSTPAGLTLVRAAGMEAVAAVGFSLNRFQTESLVAVRRGDSLQVARHLQYVVCNAGCNTSGCTVTYFEQDETAVVIGAPDDPVGLAAHLKAQNGARDALETMAQLRHTADHDPFANAAAATDLQALAMHHTQDAALTVIANHLRI